MGTCCSGPAGTVEERTAHGDIESHMKTDKHQDARTSKLLLLGAGSSGKSTLLKQMKYLYIFDNGYPESELQKYSVSIFKRGCTSPERNIPLISCASSLHPPPSTSDTAIPFTTTQLLPSEICHWNGQHSEGDPPRPPSTVHTPTQRNTGLPTTTPKA